MAITIVANTVAFVSSLVSLSRQIIGAHSNGFSGDPLVPSRDLNWSCGRFREFLWASASFYVRLGRFAVSEFPTQTYWMTAIGYFTPLRV